MWVIGSDHAATALKNTLKLQLEQAGHTVLDVSNAVSSEHVHYASMADALCAAILSGQATYGILLCGTGTGSAMRANRYNGIRAAIVTDEYMAEMARAHNNANVLVLGSRVTTEVRAQRMLALFMNTPFDGGRHTPRVAHIDAPLVK